MQGFSCRTCWYWLPLFGLLFGCGLSAAQRQDIARWEAEAAEHGHPEMRYEEELSPAKAAWLGVLPFGIGGFYVHRPGLGISGWLCWPVSLTWLPAMAYTSAQRHNYDQLQRRVALLRQEMLAKQGLRGSGAEIGAVLEQPERLRREGKISDAEYQQGRRNALESLTR